VNLIHRIYCRSGCWRARLSQLPPWATTGIPLGGATVLELGSGPGLTTDWLRPGVGALATVEYDESDAKALSRRLPDIDVYHADATALPFGHATFDVVLCFTICTTYRPASCRTGYLRSPGGCCVLVECSEGATADGVLCSLSLTSATRCNWSIPLACQRGLGQRDSWMPPQTYGGRPSVFGAWPPTNDHDPTCAGWVRPASVAVVGLSRSQAELLLVGRGSSIQSWQAICSSHPPRWLAIHEL
jgi:Methyltransferase domain